MGQMGIDRDLDTEGDRPGGWGSPGGPAGASCGAGVGSSWQLHRWRGERAAPPRVRIKDAVPSAGVGAGTRRVSAPAPAAPAAEG